MTRGLAGCFRGAGRILIRCELGQITIYIKLAWSRCSALYLCGLSAHPMQLEHAFLLSQPPADLIEDRSLFLSTAAPGDSERRIALAVVLISVLVFIGCVPFAKVPLASLPAFIPIYQSALVLNDMITAVLLFGQFNILRSRALLLLASAYLFTAGMTIAHTLTFPGLSR